MGKQKNVRYVSAAEDEHPILFAIFVRPIITIGKLWLQLLVHKEHLWAMANPVPLRRLTWFGPAAHPLHSRPAPILVGVAGARRGSRSEAVGDTEWSTEHQD